MRPTWDEYFLGIAKAVAARSDCDRRQVGAVVVMNNRVIATGYNGAPTGQPGCLDAPCPRLGFTGPSNTGYDTPEGSCIAIHAEVNAMHYAGEVQCWGATLYSTHDPCAACSRVVLSMGIGRVVTPHGAKDVSAVAWLSGGMGQP